jgi:hypothetical protein
MKPAIMRELAAISSRLSSLVVEAAVDAEREAEHADETARAVQAPPADRGDEIMRAPQIAALTGFTARYVYDQMAAQRLRSTKVGKYVVSRRAWVEEWINGGSGASGDGNNMVPSRHETHERRARGNAAGTHH